MRSIFLIGTTKDKELVFAEVENKNYFSTCFSSVMPFIVTADRCRDVAEDYADPGMMGYDVIYNLLEEYDCSPSELPDKIAENSCVEDLFDISLYPETYSIHGDDWYFESVGCGQQDLTEELAEVVSPEVYRLLGFWKTHHLKTLTNAEEAEINSIVNNIIAAVEDEEDYIIKFIKKNFYKKED